jgi:biotin synthase
MENVNAILERLKDGIFLREDLNALLNIATQEEFAPVFALSDEICRRYFDDTVYVRGIIEFSNFCRKNCMYCGIRRENEKIFRYRISQKEILETAGKLFADGVHTVVLQGGEDVTQDEMLIDTIVKLKKMFDMAVTLSVGERPEEVYRKFKEAGADRYLLRIETTDPELFKMMHPDDDLEYRKKCLFTLRALGYETGTGIMVGLPGQSIDSIAGDLLFFNELKPGMVGIGPFLAHQDTPLRGRGNTDIFPTLKVLSLIRIMNPGINLPATTAMGTIEPRGRQKALKIGANVIMPNFTPLKYREHYKLYDKKICTSEICTSACTAAIIKEAGKRQVVGKGKSLVSTEL